MAVVGSGISGLAAAMLLTRHDHPASLGLPKPRELRKPMAGMPCAAPEAQCVRRREQKGVVRRPLHRRGRRYASPIASMVGSNDIQTPCAEQERRQGHPLREGEGVRRAHPHGRLQQVAN